MILQHLQQQSQHISALTSICSSTAQSTIASQIYVLRDLLFSAQTKLSDLLMLYDPEADEVSEEAERVRTLTAKIHNLEEEQTQTTSDVFHGGRPKLPPHSPTH